MMRWINALVTGFVVVTTLLFTAEPSGALLQAKARSEEIALRLQPCATVDERAILLSHDESYEDVVSRYPELKTFLGGARPEERYVIGLMIALNQSNTLFDGFQTVQNKQAALQKLASRLVEIERFYQPIGGVLGYHGTVIGLMTAAEHPLDTDQYFPPPAQDIRIINNELWKACYEGVSKLGSTASIFALGGAGDRLNLIDPKTQEPLPAARLTFCGRSFFEGLMRDVEAQEYLHYRVFGNQVIMPTLIMTSHEKNNDRHIEAMGNEANWFGHRKDSIRRIIQPLVPVIDTEGLFAVTAPLELALKPGGHGVIWKLAQDSGALSWLRDQGIDAAIVRQVNNPMAGLDKNLAILSGYGRSNNKSFGFISCPIRPGVAEGMNVLLVSREGSSIRGAVSNIEYTKFGVLKNLRPDLFKDGACPANTNVLYINLNAINGALARNPIPGMIVNAKTNVDVTINGKIVKKVGGRLESCMQNIADGMMTSIEPGKLAILSPGDLSTFLLLQDRGKLMSSAKAAYIPGQSSGETPVSCLYDWNRAMRFLLANSCQVTLPKEQTIEEFLRDGPAVIVAVHPAMGPFWEIIGQKISRGVIASGSEVEFEIAEISCENFSVDGSLRIIADTVTGPLSETSGRMFSDKVGRARLRNVTVVNKGVKNRDIDRVLQGTIERHESCEILLKGFSEVVAENIIIDGDFHLAVPHGQRATLTQGASGKVVVAFEAIHEPGWKYSIDWNGESAPKLRS